MMVGVVLVKVEDVVLVDDVPAGGQEGQRLQQMLLHQPEPAAVFGVHEQYSDHPASAGWWFAGTAAKRVGHSAVTVIIGPVRQSVPTRRPVPSEVVAPEAPSAHTSFSRASSARIGSDGEGGLRGSATRSCAGALVVRGSCVLDEFRVSELSSV